MGKKQKPFRFAGGVRFFAEYKQEDGGTIYVVAIMQQRDGFWIAQYQEKLRCATYDHSTDVCNYHWRMFTPSFHDTLVSAITAAEELGKRFHWTHHEVSNEI